MDSHSLFNAESLNDLGSRSGVDMRPTLLRILTDLYVQKLRHTPDEERHYTELALRLLDSVDVPTRAAVAHRLARHNAPPLPVLQRLAGDLPEVSDLLHAHPLLQPTVKREPATVETEAPFVVAGALEDQDLFADMPGAIDPASADELNELFLAANASERRLILLNLETIAPLSAEGVPGSRDPSISSRLEAAVLARRPEEFVQVLARSLQIPRTQARRIMHDELGELIIAAAKALGMSREVLYRILMFVNPAIGHSVERVHTLAALYDELTPRVAEGMVAIWQALPNNEQTRATNRSSVVEEKQPPARAPSSAQRFLVGSRTSGRRNAS
jgi:uncharacterized protein (DUF2336 family)